MGQGVKRWAVALGAVACLTVSNQPAAAVEPGTVLDEILEIMKKSGQITEEQKQALIQRAQQEARQAQAERDKDIEDLAKGFTAGVENFKPYLASRDGAFKFELGGLLQLDFDTDEPGARSLRGVELFNRFLVRRARLDVTGTLFNWVGIKVEGDFADGSQGSAPFPTLKDGYVELRFLREANLRAGQFKVPFSAEELTSSRFLDFVERSVVNALSPAREQGIMLYGSFLDGVIAYNLGVFNGVPEEAPETNNTKDLAGRLVLAPFRTTRIGFLKGLYLGGDFTYGVDEGRLVSSPAGQTAARTDPRFTYFVVQPTNGDRLRWGADLTWLWGPASLKFEYDQQMNGRNGCGTVVVVGGVPRCGGGTNLDDIVASGFLVSGTYILTGEPKPLNGPVIPKRSFSPLPGKLGPGAWEVGLRYAQLDFESDDPVDFFDGNIANGITRGGRTAENGVQALTAGVNWYLNARTRLMFNWTKYWYENDLGTPFSCTGPFPSPFNQTCTASQLVPGSSSWEILTRVQVWF